MKLIPVPTDELDEDDFRYWHGGFGNPQREVLIYDHWVKYLPLDECMMLADLMRLRDARHIPQNKGWFSCTSKILNESLNWKNSTQSRLLNKLKEKGLIKVKRSGLPPIRYVKVLINSVVEYFSYKGESK